MDNYPECSICLDIYGNNINHIKAPKVLDCGDTLCKECLGDIIKRSTEDYFLCPLCQEKINKKENIDKYITNKDFIKMINSFFNISKNEIEIEDQTQPTIYNIISLGDSGVGKTCIFERLLKEKFDDKNPITIMLEIKNPYYVKYKNKRYKLIFYDTCGQEKTTSILPENYFRNSDGIIFVYDVANKNSFGSLQYWYSLCKEKLENFVGVLLGNKCDKEHQVNKEEAEQFAKEHYLEYFETSAKLDKKIKKAIAVLLKRIIDSKALYNSLSSIETTNMNSFNISEVKTEKKRCCTNSKKK